jgi:hypothetical protein
MQATVAHVYQQLRDHLSERLAAAAGPRAQLAAYIRAVVELVAGTAPRCRHWPRYSWASATSQVAAGTYDADSDQRAIGAVEQILRRGQDDGTFRTFDPFIMGSLVQRPVDGLPFLLETQPDLDLGVYAEELVETFDIATRRCDDGLDQGRVRTAAVTAPHSVT